MNRSQAAREIVNYSRMMYERGYVVATEGNISFRLSENRVLITPSALIKQFIKVSDLTEIDLEGNKVRGFRKPTTERFTHLEIYKQNPDIAAIVHAHPFYTVMASAIGKNPFEKMFLAEAGMFLKDVKIAPYAKPSTREGADAVRELCKETNILVLERHGSFTYGKDLSTAFSLLEIMEKVAKMSYFAELSGQKIAYLSDEEIGELKKIPY